MKKLPKYLSTFALALVVWGAFLVPSADAQTYPVLLQQPTQGIEGNATSTWNSYRLGTGVLSGQIPLTGNFVSFKAHGVFANPAEYVGVQINAYTDATYTTATDVCGWNATPAVYGLGAFNQVLTANNSGCSTGDGIYDSASYIEVLWLNNLSSPYGALWGIPASVAPFSLVGTDKNGVTPYLVVRGVNQSLNPADFPGSNPSGIGTSTIESYCDKNFAVGTTSLITTVGNSFAWAGCYVTSFLFVPSSGALQGFSDLVETSQGKIPFSYGYDIAGIFSSMSASSSQNFPTYSIGLNAIDFSSSTAMGPIFPTSLDFLSSTTINKFLPAGMHDLLYNFAIFVIWVEVAFLLYRKIVPTKAKV